MQSREHCRAEAATVVDDSPPVLLCHSTHKYNNSKVNNDSKFGESKIARSHLEVNLNPHVRINHPPARPPEIIITGDSGR